MPQTEVLSWREFYRLFPFDDFHRFHRPAALVAGSLGGGDMRIRLDWLQPQPVSPDFIDSDLNTFKAFGITPPRG